MIATLLIFGAYIPLIIALLAYASIFEWLLHSTLMHKPLGPMRYPYETHTLVHHRLFRADETYHLSSHADERDKHTITMAWWNALVLVPISASPFILFALFGPLRVGATAVVVLAMYYGMYEYIHWCMHLPKQRRVECLGLFRRLNGHHLLHHRYMNKNFNVVLPFADWCFGTLLTRSPRAFCQARGPSVPDVQPKGVPLLRVLERVL